MDTDDIQPTSSNDASAMSDCSPPIRELNHDNPTEDDSELGKENDPQVSGLEKEVKEPWDIKVSIYTPKWCDDDSVGEAAGSGEERTPDRTNLEDLTYRIDSLTTPAPWPLLCHLSLIHQQ